MKITLYLMSYKGYEVLKAIINKNKINLISEINIGRDKNIEKDYADEIIELCKKNNIKFFEYNETYEINSDYSFAISWRWLIKENNSKLIVFHDSLLPKYRGFSPLVNMLINKEKKIGVTALYATREYDKGDIIEQVSLKIKYPIKILDAIILISKQYSILIIKIINILETQKKIKATPQNEGQASYSLWRNEGDYLIDFHQSSEQILTFINAVSFPYKGASAFINGKNKIRIIEAELENDVKIENRDVGKVIFYKNNYPVIVCGKGLLKLTKVIDYKTKKDLLPFSKFRIKLSNKKL